MRSSPASADDALQGGEKITIYYFWGDGCPHCAKAKPFLEGLARRYPQVEIRDYEVWYARENQEPFKKMAAAFGFEPKGVPAIFVGERYWVGYNEQMGQEIEAAVAACVASGCPDAGKGVITPGSAADAPVAKGKASVQTTDVLDVPLLGPVNLASQSLLVSTLLIAFVDGYNPCSLWVLSILMALTLRTGSRKKVLLIGLVFLTVTAAVYALFIVGLFTLFTFVSFLGWIQAAVALVALFFAAVNIKDYFWYKEGLSFTIADEKKPWIYERIRNIMNASESFGGLFSATVVMAAGVSLVEFSCTAGFPVLWTNLLSAQKVETLSFVLLLAVYMVIYQLDELAIFLVAVFTLKASRLEEKQGRLLKLIGGMLMLMLAAVMLLNPALMNNLRNSLLVFGLALGAAVLVLLMHRWVLPRFGVYIGTEIAPRGDRKRNVAQRHRQRPH